VAGLTAVCDEKFALIIQPGAVGDCLLTLPLARMIRDQLHVTHLDIMGHSQYLSYLLGKTELNRLISLDSINLHRLFTDHAGFNLPEDDELIEFFRPYELIVTFLSDHPGHFERNLAFAACMTHAADVVALQLQPPDDYPQHTAHFFMQQFVRQNPAMLLDIDSDFMSSALLQVNPSEIQLGRELLRKHALEPDIPVVALHPGSGGVHKCWPLKNFQQLAYSLTQQNYQVLFIVGPAETDRFSSETLDQIASNFPLLKDLNLEQLSALLTACCAYVGNDSGISHLAGALNVPTIAIFGSSNPTHWKPLGQKVNICSGQSTRKTTWPQPQEVLSCLLSF